MLPRGRYVNPPRFFRTVHSPRNRAAGIVVKDSLQVLGITRLSRVADASGQPWYEIWWLNEEQAVAGMATKEFEALGLTQEAAAATIVELGTKRERPSWLKGTTYWTALVGVAALFGYIATLSDTWFVLCGSPDGIVQVEVDEVLKPQAVRTPFRITVEVHNNKRNGTLHVRKPKPKPIPQSANILTFPDLGPTENQVAIEPGKTEKFDYVVEAMASGKEALEFETDASAGLWRDPRHLVSDPVTIDVWQGRDKKPELVLRDSKPDQDSQPSFEVILRNSEARKHVELELTFFHMDVLAFESPDPVNAASLQPEPDGNVHEPTQSQKRFKICDTVALKEVRIPFTITTNTARTKEQWKQAIGKDITVYTQ